MFKIDKYTLASGQKLNEAEVEIMTLMNEKFTHVLIGSKNKIAFIKPCAMHGSNYIFLSIDEFINFTSDYPMIAKNNAGRAWTKWPGKNKKLDGVGFFPVQEKCPPHFFNTFIKPSVEPIEGDCSIYLSHVKNVICGGDDIAFNYLIRYFAHTVQKPEDKPSVAIIMKSVEGTGKGTMMIPLLDIFGAQGVHLNGDRHITGQFNGVIANKLLIFADEVNLTSRATADKLKSFISESTVQMEQKGLEAISIPNYARVVFASNRQHVIAAGTKERRYLVLEPNPKYAQDTEYFLKLRNWINNNGASKLLNHLLNTDITNFNPFKAPTTKALIEQKLQSLTLAQQFIFERLLRNDGFSMNARIGVTKIIDEYNHWCESKNISFKLGSARSQIGKLMAEISGQSLGRSDRGEGKYFELPDINVMRQNFAEILNENASDIFE
jgi:putative DNA primase/helicase